MNVEAVTAVEAPIETPEESAARYQDDEQRTGLGVAGSVG